MANRDVNACGLISMILGILSLFILPLYFGLAALILGVVGLISQGKSAMAITGIVLGCVSLVWYFWIAAIILG